MNDPKGSLWRKWDLHVHSPASLIQNYGGDNDKSWEKFIKDLENLPPEFKVIGINDYLFIDGYKRVLEYKNNGQLQNIDLILPVLEFRITKFAGTDSKLRKINFHVIFSKEVTPEIIQQQFLNALTSKYKLSPGLEGIRWSGIITKESLKDLGQKIKSTAPSDKICQYDSDLIEGFNNLTLNEDEILEVLSHSSYFKKGDIQLCITAIGKTEWESLSWGESSIAGKKDIINKVDLVFISSKDVEQFNNAKQKLKMQNVNDFLLDCSDAKNFSNSVDKDRIGKCFTWIKADTTFEGLKQILNEPEDRVFIGDTPKILERINNNKTKYIKTIKINKRTDSTYDEESWFEDISIDLNPELVAIIGNKGNGKSALSDIIGLVGNSKNYNHFSFLHNEKFRDAKNNKAKHFEGLIEWESGDTDCRLLSENPEEYDYEKVKYFPQKYLEILCSAVQKDEFEKELKNVIFSHVPEEDRLGKNSLDELILYQSEVIDEAVFILKEALNNLNKEIVCLEDLLDEEYKKTLDEKLKSKQNELRVHLKSKPIETKKPETDEKVEKEINEINLRLQNLSKSKVELEKEIADEQKERAILIKKKASITRVYGEIDNFKSQYERLVTKINADLNDLEIKLEDIVTFKISTTHLDKAKENVESQITVINNKLNAEILESLVYRLTNVNLKINELKGKLDEPNKRYQEYLKQIEEWVNKKKEIVGEKGKDGSIKYYKSMLNYIASTVPEELKSKRQKRLEMLRQIYKKKKELIEIFKSLYKPVETYVSQYKSEKYPVKFDATFEIQGFYENFFTHISQKAKGSFYGVEDGSKRLRGIIESTDFNNEEAVIKCIEQIVECLEHDHRDDKKEKRVIKQQLLKKDVYAFYNFLFSLDYLVPRYTLKLGEIELSQLSSGEKGALLLIFYLLIDKNDIPLVMDQPEENLDNQSVYELLVQYIKEAKKRRQIVIVTHNPNLAVVCDAEQIIYAKIDKANKNTVSYKSGSIENTEINKKIVDVLEGTMPAFSNRESKYTITRKLTVS